jgi:predicted permease
MPQGFSAPRPVTHLTQADAIELWVPIGSIPSKGDVSVDRVLVRLPTGASPVAAEAELSRRLATSQPVVEGRPAETARLIPLAQELTEGSKPGLAIFAVVVALTLALTCVSLAGLELARAVRRLHEAAVRRALGAPPERIARLMLLEGLLVALIGGTLGLLATRVSLDGIRRLVPASLPRLDAMRVDGTAVTFAVVLAIIAGLASSTFPARALVRGGRLTLLRFGRVTPPHRRALSTLVMTELGLAIALVSATGLLTRTMLRLWATPTGIARSDVLVVDLTRRRTPTGPVPATDGFFPAVLARVAALPGVEGATLASSVPFRPRDYYGDNGVVRLVDQGYFHLLGIRVEGRDVEAGDGAEAAPVAIINRALAEQLYPGESALGKMLDGRRIVGVADDVRHESLEDAPMTATYVPLAQRPDDRLALLIRAPGVDRETLLSEIRRQVAELDPAQPVQPAGTLGEVLSASEPVAKRRFLLEVLVVVAGVATLLAALGVYSVTSEAVMQRTPEFGIRMSLGASRASVSRMVLLQASRLLVVGVLLGVAAGAALARLLRSTLIGVTGLDLPTMAGVTLLFVAVVLIATLGPARRAGAIDPAEAARSAT